MSSTIVAPELGSLDEAVRAFQTPRAPYYRGGGDEVTPEFERHLNRYLGGTHCVVTPSGQAANMLALYALFPPGGKGHALVSKRLFGTTGVGIKQGFVAAGYEITDFDPQGFAVDLEKLLRKDTKFIFTEVSSNPEGVVADLDALSLLAGAYRIPLILDHTLTAGFDGFDPFRYADIVTVSLAKQTGGGRNNATGGVMLLDDKFDWSSRAEQFPAFERYFMVNNQLVLPSSQAFGALARKIATWQGTCVAPIHGAAGIMETLPGLTDRVSQMRENARCLAEFLGQHRQIERVRLAGLDDSENSDRAKKYLDGNGFVVFVDIKGGEDAARRFIDGINDTRQLAETSDCSYAAVSHSVQLGQQKTAVVVPGFTTNRQSTDDDLAARGMGRYSVRVSVGTGDAGMLLRTFDRALTHG